MMGEKLPALLCVGVMVERREMGVEGRVPDPGRVIPTRLSWLDLLCHWVTKEVGR